MLWEERTGPLYKQLEHHYDSPALWTSAMAEHEAVLKAIAAQGRRRRARRDAAPPQPGLQALQQGLGYAAVARPADKEKSMLAARIHAKEDLRLDAFDMPAPGAGEVLLKLGAGGICGSDLHYYFEGRNGSFVVREPLIPGHEASGVVVSVGAGRHARQARRQGRGVAVARLRPLRGLPRRVASSCART